MSPAEIRRIMARPRRRGGDVVSYVSPDVEIRVGVRPKLRGLSSRPRTGGFDIETVSGAPYILGLHDADAHEVREIGPGEGLPHLLRWAKRLATRSRTTVLGAHNLMFDLGVLLFDWMAAHDHRLDPDIDEFIVPDLEGGTFRFCSGKVTFGTFTIGHRSITFLDTFAYFRTSLKRAAEDLGLSEGKGDFAGREEAEWFRKRWPLDVIGPYCQQDAKLAHQLTEQIVSWWMDFGIRPSISGPQMAGRVFCKAFVTAPWVSPPQWARIFSLLAYHGGRNLFIGEPGWYPSLKSYDVNSAYTHAMTQIPDMAQGEWELGTGEPAPRSWGFVVLTGELPRFRAPVVYQDDFTPIEGPVDHLVITTQEWDLLRELAPDWQPTELAWGRFVPASDQPSDLARYAHAMWERRRESRTGSERLLYKFLSNSLYGKFIARRPLDDEGRMLVGELFYPPVAAWITALVRCQVIRAEMAYDVLHTATDGVLTTRTMPESPGLGQWKLEHEGPALILRNKVYLLWNREGRLVKAALHGFQGTANDLLTMLREGRRTYLRKRLWQIRESRRAGVRPFAPRELPMGLHVPPAAWDRVMAQCQTEPYRSLLEAR